MPQVLTAREVETLLSSGQPIPEGALLTPSARDLIDDRRRNQGSKTTAVAIAAPVTVVVSEPAPVAAAGQPKTPDLEYR